MIASAQGIAIRLAVLVCSLMGSVSCGSEKQRCTVPEGEDPYWIRIIRCQTDHELLTVQREDAIFSHTATMNWLIDREDGDRVYFINSGRFQLHYDFAKAFLQREGLSPVGTHADFNILNYRREQRRFVLGKLIHYQDQGLYTIEFSAGDTASSEMIIAAYEHLAEHVFLGHKLKYRPVSNYQETLLDEISDAIPVVRTEDVFQGQSYQALNQAAGYGVLQFRRVSELASRPPSPGDIVVLDRVPNDIALVSGLITEQFQTPLSHVNLLSKNRGTPNMALRDAFEDEELRSLEGELVRLVVGTQKFSVEVASRADAEAFWESLRPSEPLIPDFDLAPDEIQSLSDLDLTASSYVGAKAAHIAEMFHLNGAGVRLPEAPFALPFSWYQRHLEENGLVDDIEALLISFEEGSLPQDKLRTALFELRWAIYRAPMNTEDLLALRSAADARFDAGQELRFRSSTNAEDLAQFSGAGLYTSAGAALSEGDSALADAIKVVWASAWNEQAFIEREFYRVDHRSVFMGVLVHPAFADELANGVAVTINEFAENRPAFYINSQLGEVSVTNPTGRATPEQILYYTWYEEPEFEVITRSSLLPSGANRGVLPEARLHELAEALERIHGHFRGLYPGRADFAMDVEFKLASDGNLYLKQARPLATR